MRRIILSIGIIVLLALPIVMYVITRTDYVRGINWPIIQKDSNSVRYSAASDVSDFTIKITDTRYLDSIAENIGIFKPNAIIDPKSYLGGSTKRHTVTHVRFTIVPLVANMVVGVSGKKDFAARGGYTLEGNTLVVVVSFTPQEVPAMVALQHGLDDMFLRAAFQTMWYAHGLSADPFQNADAFRNIQEGIKNDLFGGILPWPIQIIQKK